MLNPNLANNLGLNSIAGGGFGHSSVKLTTAYTNFQKTPNILVEPGSVIHPRNEIIPHKLYFNSRTWLFTLIFLLAVRNRALKWQIWVLGNRTSWLDSETSSLKGVLPAAHTLKPGLSLDSQKRYFMESDMPLHEELICLWQGYCQPWLQIFQTEGRNKAAKCWSEGHCGKKAALCPWLL